MITVGFRVVGEIEDASCALGVVRLGGVRHVAVEEQHVAGLARHGTGGITCHLGARERLPFLADQAGEARSVGDLEASVGQRRRVDADERGHEQRGEDRPSGLLVLVRLEAGASRFLEIDLVLEHHRRLVDQRLDCALQPALHQLPEPGVILDRSSRFSAPGARTDPKASARGTPSRRRAARDGARAPLPRRRSAPSAPLKRSPAPRPRLCPHSERAALGSTTPPSGGGRESRCSEVRSKSWSGLYREYRQPSCIYFAPRCSNTSAHGLTARLRLDPGRFPPFDLAKADRRHSKRRNRRRRHRVRPRLAGPLDRPRLSARRSRCPVRADGPRHYRAVCLRGPRRRVRPGAELAAQGPFPLRTIHRGRSAAGCDRRGVRHRCALGRGGCAGSVPGSWFCTALRATQPGNAMRLLTGALQPRPPPSCWWSRWPPCSLRHGSPIWAPGCGRRRRAWTRRATPMILEVSPLVAESLLFDERAQIPDDIDCAMSPGLEQLARRVLRRLCGCSGAARVCRGNQARGARCRGRALQDLRPPVAADQRSPRYRTYPIATASRLAYALKAIAAKMNPDQDILFPDNFLARCRPGYRCSVSNGGPPGSNSYRTRISRPRCEIPASSAASS